MLRRLGTTPIALLKDTSLVFRDRLCEMAYAARTVAVRHARYW